MVEVADSPMESLPFPGRRGGRTHGVEEVSNPLGGSPVTSIQESPVQFGQIGARQPQHRSVRGQLPRYMSMEDMYEARPEIATIGKIRVIRKAPQWFADPDTRRRYRVNGIVGEHETQMSTEDIAKAYGGYKIVVVGMLEQENKDDPGGPSHWASVAEAVMEFASDPVLGEEPIAEEDGGFMAGAWPVGGRRASGPQYVQSSGPDLNEVLRFAETLSSRDKGSAPSDSIFQTVARQGEATAAQVKEMAQMQINALERQNDALREQMAELQRQNAQVQAAMHERPNDIVSLTQAVAALNQSSHSSASSDELQALHAQHERELSRMRDEHARQIDMLTRERDREIDRARSDLDSRQERAEERVREIREGGERREKELREAADRRERELRDDFERRERYAKDEAKRALEAQKQGFESRIEEMRQMHDRELRMVKSMQDNASKTTEAAHNIQLRASENELAKLTAELKVQQKLVDQHMAEKNKPLLDQVQDIQQMAELLGVGGTPEAEAAPPVESSTKEKLINGLIAQAGPLLANLTTLVKRPGSVQGPAAAVPQAPQYPAQQAARALPPRQYQRMTFADSEGPSVDTGERSVTQQYSAPEDDGYGVSDFSPVVPPQFEQPGSSQTKREQPAPVQPTAASYVQAQQPAQQAAPQLQQPQQVQEEVPKVAEKEPWSEFAWVPYMDQEGVKNLLGQLEGACRQGMDPKIVVEEFCNQHGKEIVAMIPSFIEVSKLVESIRADVATKEALLASGRGKRYLEDVWAQIASLAETVNAQQEAQEAEASAPTSSSSSDIQQPQEGESVQPQEEQG